MLGDAKLAGEFANEMLERGTLTRHTHTLTHIHKTPVTHNRTLVATIRFACVRWRTCLLTCCPGIYVIGFSYPVVPKGKARIRVQLSAAHTTAQIDRAVDAFIEIGKKKGVIA